MTILLIRHADAGERHEWEGDDRLRPLSHRGERQARRLPELLAGMAPARILSSPYVRCVQTVEPLAAAVGVGIEESSELAEGADGTIILGASGDGVAFCTHGDVCDLVLGHLFHLGLVDRTARAQKGSTWILERSEDRIVGARYLAPPA